MFCTVMLFSKLYQRYVGGMLWSYECYVLLNKLTLFRVTWLTHRIKRRRWFCSPDVSWEGRKASVRLVGNQLLHSRPYFCILPASGVAWYVSCRDFVLRIKLNLFRILSSHQYCYSMTKMNNFGGDLTNILDQTTHWFRVLRIVCHCRCLIENCTLDSW